IHGKHALGNRFVNDRIRIGASLHSSQRLESLKVEDGDGVRASVADKSTTQIGCDGYPMHTLRIGNVTYDFVGICVEHDNVRSIRNVDASRSAVDGHVVPSFIPGNRYGFGQMVLTGLSERGSSYDQ